MEKDITGEREKEIRLLKALSLAANDRAIQLELRGAKSRHEMSPREWINAEWADWEFSKVLNEYLNGEVDWVHDWFRDMCQELEVDQHGEDGCWIEGLGGVYND